MEEAMPLINVCREDSLERIEEILQTGADVTECDKLGRTALHLTAERGRCDVMQVLIDRGADVRSRDKMGNTPLHYCGHLETVQCLLISGVDVNERNKHGDTPLMLLRRRGVEEAAITLLETFEEDEVLGPNGQSQPPDLLSQSPTPARESGIKHIWFDFCLDLGPERLVCVLLVILALSLYIAYLATDFARTYDTRIPIVDGDQIHYEL